MAKDIVNITCYRTRKAWKRDEAIKFFAEASFACEGSEKERYENILVGLVCGLTEISDIEIMVKA